jgi:hypothetical protein
MEELRLHFVENDFRVFYENSYTELRNDLRRQLTKRRKILTVLVVLTVLSFSLIVIDKRWINYGLDPFCITLLFIVWTEWIKSNTKKYIDDSRTEIDKYLSHLKNINDFTYRYDNAEIKYYEAGELKNTFLWTDLHHVQYYEACFILHFNPSDTKLLFFRSMINQDELKKFEATVVDKIKNTR